MFFWQKLTPQIFFYQSIERIWIIKLDIFRKTLLWTFKFHAQTELLFDFNFRVDPCLKGHTGINPGLAVDANRWFKTLQKYTLASAPQNLTNRGHEDNYCGSSTWWRALRGSVCPTQLLWKSVCKTLQFIKGGHFFVLREKWSHLVVIGGRWMISSR